MSSPILCPICQKEILIFTRTPPVKSVICPNRCQFTEGLIVILFMLLDTTEGYLAALEKIHTDYHLNKTPIWTLLDYELQRHNQL